MGISKNAVIKAFKDLQEYKLIEVVRQGQGKPNRIYVLDYKVSEDTLKELSYKNKKDLGAVTTKPSEDLKNKKDSYNINSNKDSIPQNSNSNNKSNKEFKPNYSLNPKIHKNLSTKFLNYGSEEDLERMLLENQKSKFNEN